MRNNDDYTEIFRLKTRFVTPNAYLTIGTPHGVPGINGIPSPPSWLYLVQGKRHPRIQHLNDLTGKVRIESPEAALSYVRLYTSPCTRSTLWNIEIPAFARRGVIPYLEVIPVARLDADFVYGATSLLASLRGSGRIVDWSRGSIVHTDVKHKDLHYASVRKERGGFSIRRPLMVAQKPFSPSYAHLVAVEEWVGQSGEFKVEKVTLLDDALVQRLGLYFLDEE